MSPRESIRLGLDPSSGGGEGEREDDSGLSFLEEERLLLIITMSS